MKASGACCGTVSNPKVDRGEGCGRAWPREGANSSTSDKPNTCLPPPCPPYALPVPPSSGLSCVQNPHHHLTRGPTRPWKWMRDANQFGDLTRKIENANETANFEITFAETLADKVRRRLASPMPSRGFESHKCRVSGCIRQMTQHQPDQWLWDIFLATRQPGDVSTCKADLGSSLQRGFPDPRVTSTSSGRIKLSDPCAGTVVDKQFPGWLGAPLCWMVVRGP